MNPKMGRPIIGKPKDRYLTVRVDEDTLRKVDECVNATGSTKTEIVREGIDMVWRKAIGANKK